MRYTEAQDEGHVVANDVLTGHCARGKMPTKSYDIAVMFPRRDYRLATKSYDIVVVSSSSGVSAESVGVRAMVVS